MGHAGGAPGGRSLGGGEAGPLLGERVPPSGRSLTGRRGGPSGARGCPGGRSLGGGETERAPKWALTETPLGRESSAPLHSPLRNERVLTTARRPMAAHPHPCPNGRVHPTPWSTLDKPGTRDPGPAIHGSGSGHPTALVNPWRVHPKPLSMVVSARHSGQPLSNPKPQNPGQTLACPTSWVKSLRPTCQPLSVVGSTQQPGQPLACPPDPLCPWSSSKAEIRWPPSDWSYSHWLNSHRSNSRWSYSHWSYSPPAESPPQKNRFGAQPHLLNAWRLNPKP